MPERLRRGLLGLTVVLLVARPLGAGEDPGGLLAASAESGAGPVVTLGWFAAVFLAAVWHAWANPGRRLAGWTEAGLTLCAAVSLLGAVAVAGYQLPAWRITWETAALAAAFVVVRQIFVDPVERHRLLAALLATGVTVAAHAAYQTAVERGLPQAPAIFRGDPVAGAAAAAAAAEDDDIPPFEAPSLPGTNPFGPGRATFSNPETAQGWLVLLFPAILVAAVAASGWKRWAGFVLALGPLVGALSAPTVLLILSLQAGALAFVLWRRRRPNYDAATVTSLAVLALLAALIGLVGVPLEVRAGWSAALGIIRSHGIIGVGPGQFIRFAARSLPVDAELLPTRAHSYWLGLLATGGLPALAAIVATLAALVVSLRRPTNGSADTPGKPRPPLEFYFGGLIGLTVGLGLQVFDLSAAAGAGPIPARGAVAVVRSLVWFAAFGLFDGSPWPGSERRWALAAGLIGVLVLSLWSDALAWPALAQPFWVAAALMLPSNATTSAWARSVPGRVLPLAVTIVATVAFVQAVFLPDTREAAVLREARVALPGAKSALRALREAPENLKPFKRGEAIKYVQTFVDAPLSRAIAANPTDIIPYLSRAQWLGWLWWLSSPGDTAKQAIDHAALAMLLDPEGTAGLQMLLRLRLRFAVRLETKGTDQLIAADSLIDAILRRDPTAAARLHFLLAWAHDRAGDRDGTREHAEQARQLDANAPGPLYQLTAAQREQLPKWLAP